MSCIQNCVCSYKNRHFIISLLFLLISSLTNIRFMVEGRAISQLLHSASARDHAPNGREEKVAVARRLIGSKPPRCEKRCSSCGHCEAIQVPAVPRLKSHATARRSTTHYGFSTAPATSYSRGDDISNYKPIFWKCKCGNFFFNP